MNQTTNHTMNWAPAGWVMAASLAFAAPALAQEAHDHGAHEAAPAAAPQAAPAAPQGPGAHEHDHHRDHGRPGPATQPGRDQAHGHDGHGASGEDAHDHHGHGAAPVAEGPWSYIGRDNPEPYVEDRWVMVPVPGEAHAFRFVGEVEAREVCAGLDGARVMVDRATREACEARPDALPFQGVAQAAPRGDGGAGAGQNAHGANGHPHHHGQHGNGQHDGHGQQGQGRPDHGPADAPTHGEGARRAQDAPPAAPDDHDGHRH